LSRGFTHYEDYIFPKLTALKTCAMVSRALGNYEVVIHFTRDNLQNIGLLDAVEFIHESLNDNRKDAAEVNRELLDWLSTRDQPGRPFFAFLNYFDAHYRYVLKPGRLRRFGAEPDDEYKRILIDHWATMDKAGVSPSGVAFASDAYDDCIADLDEQVGKLIDRLHQRGILEHTLLIVVSDHGESFGEHPNTFCHGTSLFDTEVHVPLLIIPPSHMKTAAGLAIRDPVSLRDIAATVADITGLTTDSSFPGGSLMRFWKNPSPASRGAQPPSLSELVPNDPKSRDYWGLPKPLPPRASLKDSEWSYMRREVEVGEQLYHLTEDTREQRNLAGDPSAQETLRRLRTSLDQQTSGPLLPSRFPP
jgi:arylsulfatase A-like enzyme